MMNIKVEKKLLANAVSSVLKAVPGKTTMAILNNILISAVGNEIVFVGNDLELGISTSVEGEIIEQGKTTLDARLFSEIVRKMPDGNVSIVIDEKGTATVKCGKSRFSLATKDADEFPLPPFVEETAQITLSEYSLRDAINKTLFCINLEEVTNKMMAALFFQVNGSHLRITGLDGHRIGIRNIELAEENPDIKAILPGKTLAELVKILSGGIDDKVKIQFGKNHVVFRFGNTVVTSRLIEGNYFMIDKMINGDTPIHMSVNRLELTASIDRALTLTGSEKLPVIFDIKGNTLSLSTKSARGELSEELDIETSGSELRIAFNPKFMIETLKALDEEKVDIYLNNPRQPAFVKNEKGEYLYVILPVNIRA